MNIFETTGKRESLKKKIIKQERKKRHKEENVKFRIEKHNNQNYKFTGKSNRMKMIGGKIVNLISYY